MFLTWWRTSSSDLLPRSHAALSLEVLSISKLLFASASPLRPMFWGSYPSTSQLHSALFLTTAARNYPMASNVPKFSSPSEQDTMQVIWFAARGWDLLSFYNCIIVGVFLLISVLLSLHYRKKMQVAFSF